MAPLRLNISLLFVLLCRIAIGVSMSFISTSAFTLTILYRRRSAAWSFFNILARFGSCLLAFFVNFKGMFDRHSDSLVRREKCPVERNGW